MLGDMAGIIVACVGWVVAGAISDNGGGFKAVSEAGMQ
jgi:hypothetical protein